MKVYCTVCRKDVEEYEPEGYPHEGRHGLLAELARERLKEGEKDARLAERWLKKMIAAFKKASKKK